MIYVRRTFLKMYLTILSLTIIVTINIVTLNLGILGISDGWYWCLNTKSSCWRHTVCPDSSCCTHVWWSSGTRWRGRPGIPAGTDTRRCGWWLHTPRRVRRLLDTGHDTSHWCRPGYWGTRCAGRTPACSWEGLPHSRAGRSRLRCCSGSCTGRTDRTGLAGTDWRAPGAGWTRELRIYWSQILFFIKVFKVLLSKFKL